VEAAVVEKSGSWFSYNGQRLGQGREQTVGFLKANPKIGEELMARLKEKALDKAEKVEKGVLQPA
jgi:recombination protein RecA